MPERYPNLMLLAAAQTIRPETVTEEALRTVLAGLSERADHILIDSPAGIGDYFQKIIPIADEGIVVTAPVVSAVRDADKVLHLLEAAGVKERSIIVNGIRPELVRTGDMMQAADIADVLGTKLLGVVPDDTAVIAAANQGVPVTEAKSPAGEAYGRIVRRILGEELPVPPLRKMKKGWFRR